MSAWLGLHNPEAHKSLPPTEHEEAVPACLDCESWCDESMPCRCCLAAEVERLSARMEAAEAKRDVLRAERDVLRERSEAALAFCDEFSGVQVAVTTARILRGTP